MEASIRRDIEGAIGVASGTAFAANEVKSVSGGCINAAYVISDSTRRYFVKVNDAVHLRTFEAEAAGLQALGSAKAVRVPHVICAGANANAAWLALEFIALVRRSANTDAVLGRAVAKLHMRRSDTFGWDRDNTIGPTPQVNTRTTDWATFWCVRRLEPQLELARANGYSGNVQVLGAKLLERVRDVLNHQPAPALLHGDLWSGNAAADENGAPVLFDPAVYYGDREADIAMTELFGGFTHEFYRAYEDVLPLDSGYAVRKDVYNLYHVLNHVNLFGGSYLGQAERMIAKLLAELR